MPSIIYFCCLESHENLLNLQMILQNKIIGLEFMHLDAEQKVHCTSILKIFKNAPQFSYFFEQKCIFFQFFSKNAAFGMHLDASSLKNASFFENLPKMHPKIAPLKCIPKVHAPRCVNSNVCRINSNLSLKFLLNVWFKNCLVSLFHFKSFELRYWVLLSLR